MTGDSGSGRDRWAYLRFSIIGGLLACPPEPGQLRVALEALAKRAYSHPTRPDESITFSLSTLERWFYLARNADDPIEALCRKTRADVGQTRVMTLELVTALGRQYEAHRRWTYQLHYDNLAAWVGEHPELGALPSYSTVHRRMRQRGWVKQRGAPRHPTAGQQRALSRLEKREVRSYEASHVGALWHLDFHEGSLSIVDAGGNWHTPCCLAVIDDFSRLCCHIQWYFVENAENLVHGLSQAFHKRRLPRALMTDRGGAMLAAETRNGLARLAIQHQPTLSYSPYQNGKQESFWGVVEGRLMAMLEGVKPLTLAFLNRASLAWLEGDYNRRLHDEIGTTPLARFLEGPDVSRSSLDSEALRRAFTRRGRRTQRKSDGTISIQGVRFEIPSHLRLLSKLRVRYQSWDLSSAYIVDDRDEHQLLARIYPLDKAKNADGRRRALPPTDERVELPTGVGADQAIPPLMRKLLADYAATGLPPAYLPKDDFLEDDDV